MPKVIWLMLCVAIYVHGYNPVDIDTHTSPHPIVHGLAVSVASGLATIRDALLCRHDSDCQSWFQPQFPVQREEAVQWLGHATALIKTSSCTMITDPVFWDIPMHQRYVPSGVSPAWLPHIDVILISHDHYDHLNKATLRYLLATQDEQPHVICPRGVHHAVAQCGFEHITQASWWERIDICPRNEPISVTCVPACHWSGRAPHTLCSTLWAGWLVNGRYTYYFAGDTAYHQDMFRSIGNYTRNIDVALLPIGPCTPSCYTRYHHMQPDEVSRAIHDLGTKRAIPIHWGVFKMGPGAPQEPIELIKAIRRKDAVVNSRLRMLTVGGAYMLKYTHLYGVKKRIIDD